MARVGRPFKFKSPEELLDKAQAYFDEAKEKEEPLTITGLALALDTSRETLMDYEEKRGKRFSDAIKKVKLVCENYAEKMLFKSNPTGAIFALKNYGWKDRQEIDLDDSQLEKTRNDLNNLIKDVKAATSKTDRE